MDGKQRSLLVKHDWKLIVRLWPALVEAPPSEKPSVIQLLDALANTIYRFIETTALSMIFTPECLVAARYLSSNASLVSLAESQAAEQWERDEADNSKKLYYQLLDSLSNLLTSGSLHWRLYNLAFNMLTLQMRADLPLPATCVHIFVHNLIHDAIAVRKIAIKGVAAILKQHKRTHPRIVVDPRHCARQYGSNPLADKARADTTEPENPYGDRWETSWMQYNADRRPMTAEAWNQPR